MICIKVGGALTEIEEMQTYADGCVHVRKSDNHTYVEVWDELIVDYEGGDSMEISMAGPTLNTTSGFCGNNDQDPGNDFVLQDGSTPMSLEDFIRSWQAEDQNDTR